MKDCRTCTFWHGFSTPTPALAGTCQRRSPVLVDRSWNRPDGDSYQRIIEVSSEWPTTSATDTCGDHERRLTVVDHIFDQRDAG